MKHGPQVFFIYAREDGEKVKEIYGRLSSEGLRPWMDSMNIRAGQAWMNVTKNELRNSDLVLLFLSENFLSKKYPHTIEELNMALEIAANKPKDTIFLVPIRLEACDIPPEVQHIQWVDLFDEEGWEKLMFTLTLATLPQLPQPEPPKDLIEACADGECVLYGGAGLSAPAGFPTWGGFVEGLLDWATADEFIEKKTSESLRTALRQGDIDTAADGILMNLENNDLDKTYFEYLEEIFLSPMAKLPQAHRLLKKIPFSAVLTTNLDNLLEQTYKNFGDSVYTPVDAEELQKSLHSRDFFLLKLYGTLEKPDTVLLSPTQYEDTVAGNLLFSEFMESLFFSRTLLFIGASLEGIEDYLGGLTFRGYIPRQHYALVAVSGGGWETKADLLQRRYGIRVLPYTYSETHPEVPDFLEKLAKAVQKQKKQSNVISLEITRGGRPKEKEGLKRVILKNIGTFSHLELDLHKGWNVLLGDNGVGKSTILKAIAAGMSGKEAQSYAHRLIKSGQTEATIVLETEKNRYMTTLLKKNGRAEVKAIGRFLDTESCLALGFPPLRSVSWKRPEGPQLVGGVGRPTADDLMPLIAGIPDPRMDKLKQWIINLDYYRSKAAQAGDTGDGHDPYGTLLENFFSIISELTQGLTLRFKEVNLSTHEVTVISDDGEIPLEAASQGTISLIGWVGTLLQRLYEVYPGAGNPHEQYALVLIDEIDAHMHPSWQLTLIPALEKLFPNIQFIASTHSPLIVGSREPEEVIFLRRDKENPSHVNLERPREPFKGWRADQILTSPLFDLSSSREPGTIQLLMEYSKLAAKDEPTEKERKRLDEAAARLKLRLPSAEERAEARKASQMIMDVWKEKLKQMPGEERKKVIDEIKRQTLESITRSRSPQ